MSALAIRSTRRRHAGFSIVELMVVTLVGLIVFGLGFTIINSVTRARAQTEARVRASENARLFFQVLEKDLAAGNPGPQGMIKDRADVPAYPCAAPQPTVLQENVGGTMCDILQFYTRADASSVTDEYVFVRYFVNRANNTICRQVVPLSDNSAVNAPELVDNPTAYTNSTDPVALQYALFDEVKAFYVVHRTWNATEKALLPNTVPDYVEESNPVLRQNSTHLRVMLVMRYTVDGGATYLERTFSKALNAPWQTGG